MARALWTTLRIATLGTVLTAMLALPLGLLAARNPHAPRALSWAAKGLLDALRSIHTLVFSIILGLVGAGGLGLLLSEAMSLFQ